MRQVQSLSKQSYEGLILLQPPLDSNDSGKFRIFRVASGGGDGKHNDGDEDHAVSYHAPIDFLSIIEWFDEQQRAHHQRLRNLWKQQKEQEKRKAIVPRIYHTGNFSLAFFDLTAKASNIKKKSSNTKSTSINASDDEDRTSDDEDNDDDDSNSDQDNKRLDSKTKRNVQQRPAKSWEYYLHPEWQGEQPSSGTTATTTTTTTFLPMDEHSAVWCHVDALARAIRVSFRNANVRDFPIVPDLHQRAIAAYRMLQHVQSTWSHTSVHTERDIRIACTSSCVAKSYHASTIETVLGGKVIPPGGAVPKYRYAYRIRVENLSPPSSGNTVQLLGRTWFVHQNTMSDHNDNVTSENEKDHSDDHNDDDNDDDVVRVVAPNTGVVGQLPVLSPGTVFEYQSGAEAGARGRMEGCLHFCVVPDDTPSTTIGTSIPAFESDQRFAVPVKPFPLVADDFNMENTDT